MDSFQKNSSQNQVTANLQAILCNNKEIYKKHRAVHGSFQTLSSQNQVTAILQAILCNHIYVRFIRNTGIFMDSFQTLSSPNQVMANLQAILCNHKEIYKKHTGVHIHVQCIPFKHCQDVETLQNILIPARTRL